MSQHSPAPWVADDQLHVYPSGGEAEGPLCICSRFNCPETEAANARLIAAAPELLGALRFVTEQLGEVSCARRSIEAIQEAKAAISRATT